MWALIGLCAALTAGIVGVVVHMLDIITTEREAHRLEVRALLARAGAPVLPVTTNRAEVPPFDPNRFAWDPSGLEGPIPLETE